MVESLAVRQGPVVPPIRGVRQVPFATRLIVRGNDEVMRRVSTVLSMGPTLEACRAATSARAVCLWLGPDERMIIAADGEAVTLAERLEGILADQPHSLVDVSHRQTALEVSGPAATLMLNTGCPLDLDPAAFPVGMCTRTVFAKTPIVLWRTATSTFHVEVWRSFTDYLCGLLALASEEYGA